MFDNTTVVCLLHHLVVEPLILGNSTTHHRGLEFPFFSAGNTPILSALRNRKRKLPSDLQDLYLESIEKRNEELEEKSKTPECPVRIISKSKRTLVSIL